MEDTLTLSNTKAAVAELLTLWLPLLDQINGPGVDDSQIAIAMGTAFSTSPLAVYWGNDKLDCPEPLLIDIVDIYIGMDNAKATPSYPWETYESIHSPHQDVRLTKKQQLWHHRQQAWMYVRTLVYVLQRRYLPDGIPPQGIAVDYGTTIKPTS